jgi:SAM-dependent methyltransferase
MGNDARLFFDAIAGRYDRVYSLAGPESRHRLTTIIPMLPAPPGDLLDLGVGTGRELSALQDAGFTVVGVDISSRMLEACARRTRPISLVCHNFWEPLPFESQAFDGAISLHGALSHPPDEHSLRRLALEVHRVLRPGSPFLFEVPSTRWLESIGSWGVRDERGHLVRLGSSRWCQHVDDATGATVRLGVWSASEWQDLLGTEFDTSTVELGPEELFVMARRR